MSSRPLPSYRETMQEDRRLLLDRFKLMDLAIKVVGVGSVGTFCGILLLMASEHDPLFLQVKQARPSVLEAYAGKSLHANHGQRIVHGCRMMQSASDLFLGWTEGEAGRHFYIRQLKDMKIKPMVEVFTPSVMLQYAEFCGWTLAHAHARSGEPAKISGYLGKSDKFDEAIADFSVAYADQSERDHEVLMKAVRAGKLEALIEEDRPVTRCRPAPMDHVPANADELYFERGGPIQGFVHRLAVRWGLGHSIGTRILGFLAVTWLPLVVLALLEGRALGSSPQESLLLDFGTYARFFLGVPLLLIAEPVVGPRLTAAGLQFVKGGFVRPEDYPAFERAIARAAKWRESVGAELMILAVAVTGAWLFTPETLTGEVIASWRSPNSPGAPLGISLTALWYRLIAVPILQFFWYRWLWRLFVWASFLWSVSRLNLNLVGTHADQAGGLGFLGTAHMSLGIFAVALSSVLSAEAAFLIVFHHATIETFQVPFAVLIVAVELMFLGPLLIFTPLLLRTRLSWLRDYGLLVTRYNRAFHEKWILGQAAADEPLLGSADIQSLADLGSSFEYLRGMKVVPFSLRVVIQLALVTSLPCLPLILLVVPVGQILDLLTKAVF